MHPELKLLSHPIVFLVFLCTISDASAQKQSTFTTTAVPFLRISPDARSSAMGDLGVATPADVYAGFWNMGKVAFNKGQGGAAVTYIPWLKSIANDISVITASGFYKWNEDEAISLGIRYFNLGQIDFTTNGNDVVGSASPTEMSLSFGYSRKLSQRSGLGLSIAYIHSALMNAQTSANAGYKSGTSLAADIGYYLDLTNENNRGFSFGVALANLGSKISYNRNSSVKDFIPANLSIGSTWQTPIDTDHKLSFGIQVNKILVPVLDDTSAVAMEQHSQRSVVSSWTSSFNDLPGRSSVSLGAEYSFQEWLNFRSGYLRHLQAGEHSFISAGVGLQYRSASFNFSYLHPVGNTLMVSPLSNTLRFSIAYQFSSSKN